MELNYLDMKSLHFALILLFLVSCMDDDKCYVYVQDTAVEVDCD
jgi:hypothetical protein